MANPKRFAAFASTFRQIWKRLRGGQLTPGRAAGSVALGVFVGCLPLYGVQFWICLIALPLHLDYPLALLSTLIANPLTMPFLFLIEVEIGAFVLESRMLPFSFSALRANGLLSVIGYASVGSVVLGTLLAAIAGSLAHLWLRRRLRTAAAKARKDRPSQPVPSVRPS